MYLGEEGISITILVEDAHNCYVSIISSVDKMQLCWIPGKPNPVNPIISKGKGKNTCLFIWASIGQALYH